MCVGFIVDASNIIGTGHWSRCINLSKIIDEEKHYFISRSALKNNKIKSKIKIIKISKNKFNIEELKNKIRLYKIKILVIDNYQFNYSLQKKIKKYVEKLIVIDDYYNKKYYCDIFLNYSFLSKKEKKIIKKNNPYLKVALGPKYLPLNNKFLKLKKKIKARKKIKKIMIFFGGSDKLNLTSKILPIVNFFKKIKFLVIIGNLNKNKKKIIKISKKYKNISLFKEVTNVKMAYLISQSDLAIGAGGVNLFERLYLGLPSLVIQASKNQLLNIKNSEKKGLVVNLGINNSITNKKIINLILLLIKNKNRFKKFSINCLNSLENIQNYYLKKIFKLKKK